MIDSQTAKVGIISLGCARNLVDSEGILTRLNTKGYRIVDIDLADIAIVNTCSFIKEAKQESIDVILDLIDLKKQGKLKKIIVNGCLSERYNYKLLPLLKEIDAFVGRSTFNNQINSSSYPLTPEHFRYVKICESCINHCSYCIIPKIKGKFQSREFNSIIEEAKFLDAKKTSEINLIGQDITAYGLDLYKKYKLCDLLKELTKVTHHIKWFRLLYTYPLHFNDALIQTIKEEEKICKYIDLPIQHINDQVLKEMNRGYTQEFLLKLLDKLRKTIPNLAIRTSLIVGFPGETEAHFKELMDFIAEQKFQRLGVFKYSREEDTQAYDFKNQIPEKIKQERFNALMQRQQKISEAINRAFLGKKLEVLIDEIDAAKENLYLGRTSIDAPEVDGLVYVHANKKLNPGDFVKAKITDTYEYDLVGELAE